MLTNDKDKQILTSSTQLFPEQTIHIVLKDGKAKAQIVDVNTEKNTTEISDIPS